jgi:hypothetical protein
MRLAALDDFAVGRFGLCAASGFEEEDVGSELREFVRERKARYACADDADLSAELIRLRAVEMSEIDFHAGSASVVINIYGLDRAAFRGR